MEKKEELLCRRCGEPVTDDQGIKDYDLFEKMHWLCFHFEFEHVSGPAFEPDENGNVSPDTKPCDDPSCPLRSE